MKKKGCYIYTRVSTLAQVDGFSLEAQKEELERYAACNGLDIAGRYCDAGISGGSVRGRHDFQRMMDDIVSEKDSIAYVLVFKLSRFGRNAADVLRSVQMLQDYDVNLVCVNDGIDSSTSGGRLMLSILSAVAEIEKENISVQFTAGRIQKFLEGGWAGGPVPYGYRSEGGRLYINEEEAAIVKAVFEMYIQDDTGINTIIRFLNDNGYKTRKNAVFKRENIIGMLANPIYCGDMYFNRRAAVKKGQKKEVISAEGIHEPIVSKELFYLAKSKYDDKSRVMDRVEDPDRVSILSGIVKCPLCGAGLISIIDRGVSKYTGKQNKTFYAYVCPNHKKSTGRTCEYNRQLRQELIDGAVCEYIERVRNLKSFNSYMEDRLLNADEYDKIDNEIRALRKEYYKKESQKDKLNKDIDALDVLNPEYDSLFSDLSAQVDALYDELDRLEDEMERKKKFRNGLEESRMTLKKIYDCLDRFPEVYGKMTCREKREMMRLMIERIDVFPKRREDGKWIKTIEFKFPMYKIEKNGNPVELLDQKVGYKLRCDTIGRTATESKATYPEIKKFIYDKHKVKVSSLYIAQVKRKNGIIERKNYNLSKTENAKELICPPYKEELIVEALIHFKMIEKEVTA